MDRIKIEGMEFKGRHGCLPVERTEGQLFYVDLAMEMDLSVAGQSDALADTINYAETFEIVRSVIEGEPLKLIEAVAEKIAGKILAGFGPLQAVEVTVHKPYAPISGRFRDVMVSIRRSR